MLQQLSKCSSMTFIASRGRNHRVHIADNFAADPAQRSRSTPQGRPPRLHMFMMQISHARFKMVYCFRKRRSCLVNFVLSLVQTWQVAESAGTASFFNTSLRALLLILKFPHYLSIRKSHNSHGTRCLGS